MLNIINSFSSQKNKNYDTKQTSPINYTRPQGLTADAFERKISFKGRLENDFTSEIYKRNTNEDKLWEIIKNPEFDPNSMMKIPDSAFNQGTPLFYFVFSRKPKFVAELLKNPKTDPNIVMPGAWEYAALHYAVFHDREDCVSELLKSDKIDIFQQSQHLGNPIQIARTERKDTIRKLLEARIKPIDLVKHELTRAHSDEKLLELMDREDFDPNMIVDESSKETLLMNCAEKEWVGASKKLLQNPKIDAEMKNSNGQTAKDIVSSSRNLSLKEAFGFNFELEEKFKQEFNKRDLNKKRLLEIIRDPEFNPNMRFQPSSSVLDLRDTNDYTPLFALARRNIPDLIEELLKNEKTDPNLNCCRGVDWTALNAAVYYGNVDSVDALLKSDKIDMSLTDRNGRTVFNLAEESSRRGEIKELLMSKMPIKDKVIFLLKESNSEEKLLELMDNDGFDPNMIVGEFSKETLLMNCAEKEWVEASKKLLQNPKTDAGLKNSNGQTAKDIASTSDSLSLKEVFGFNVELEDKFKQEMNKDNIDEKRLLEIIQDKDFNPNLQFRLYKYDGSQDVTPLYAFVVQNKPNLIAELVKNEEVDPNITSSRYRWTPIMYAAWNGRKECINELLKSEKIDLSIKDSDGDMALKLANHSSNSTEIKELLMSKMPINDRVIFVLRNASSEAKLLELMDNDGFDPNMIVDERVKQTLLMNCAENGWVDASKKLLQNPKIDAGMKSSYGNTAKDIVSASSNLSLKEAFGFKVTAEDKFKQEMNRDNIDEKRLLEIIQDKDFNPNLRFKLESSQYGNDVTPLYAFVVQNKPNLIAELLKNEKVDLNLAINNNRWTPIMYAAWHGRKDCINELLKSEKVDLSIKDSDGDMALNLARNAHNSTEIKELLMSKMPLKNKVILALRESNSEEKLLELMDKDGFDPNMIVDERIKQTLLMNCAENGWVDASKKLLENPKIDLEAKNSNGKTAKNLAAYSSNLSLKEVFGYKLTSREKFIQEFNKSDVNKERLLEIIRDPEFDPNMRFQPDRSVLDLKNTSDYTPLYVLSKRNMPDLIEELLKNEKTNPNLTCCRGVNWTALHEAVSGGKIGSVAALLKSEKIDLSIKDSDGDMALKLANHLSNSTEIKELLMKKMSIKDKVIFSLSESGSEEKLLELMDNDGFDPNMIVDERIKQTLLMNCAENGRVEASKKLLQNPKIDAGLKNSSGDTAKDIALTSDNLSLKEAFGYKLTSREKFIQEFNKSDVNKERLLEIIRDPEFDPNMRFQPAVSIFNYRDTSDYTPLYVFVARKMPDMIEELLKNEKTDVNLICCRGIDWTALGDAAYYGNFDSVAALLKSDKIDMSLTDNQGRTVFDLAENSPRRGEIKELLMSKMSIKDKVLFSLRSNPLEEKLLELIDNDGFDPNVIINQNRKQTLLIYCVENEWVDAAKKLLQNPKIDAGMKNSNGNTAKDIASNSRNLALKEVFGFKVAPEDKFIQEINAVNINEKRLLEIIRDPEFDPNMRLEITYLNYNGEDYTPLYAFVARNKHQLVAELLKNEKVDPNVKSGYARWTPLHQAARHNQTDCVTELLKSDKINVKIQDNDRRTATDIANQNGHEMVLRAIVEYETIGQKKAKLNAAMKEVSEGGEVDISKLRAILTDTQFDGKVVDSNGDTPLHIASKTKNPEALELIALAIAGGVSVNAQNKKQITPLINAVMSRDLRKIQFLLTKGANIDKADAKGQSPLHYAAYMQDENIIKLLLNAFPDISLATQTGKTVFDFVKGNAKLTNLFEQFKRI